METSQQHISTDSKCPCQTLNLDSQESISISVNKSLISTDVPTPTSIQAQTLQDPPLHVSPDSYCYILAIHAALLVNKLVLLE
jgi:hypothetical protein